MDDMNDQEKTNEVTCQMCGAKFGSDAELDEHNEQVHGMAKNGGDEEEK